MNEDVERLYEEARALEPAARPAFVEKVCRGEPRLREELLSLLDQAEEAETYFALLSDAVFAMPLETSPPDSEPAIGDTIGQYRILSRVGSGGMGTIYRAHDTRLDREVALKILPLQSSVEPDAEERLLAEARSAAALEHPNVCSIYEIGRSEEGRPFLAMALYEGETLKERLRRGPMALEETVEIAIQIARGLSAAHKRGIVHRDIKPGNVMLGTDGTVRILDFGLAAPSNPTSTPGVTAAGTLAYMSPEQARGDPLDPRTDLWSLGVVLYEMLAGERPFRGENELALLHAIVHVEPEPVSKLRSEVRPPLARVLEKLLRKDLGARYGTAAEVTADLAGAGRPAISRRHRAVLLTGGGATAAFVLAGALLWLPGRGGSPADTAAPSEPSIVVLPLENLSADPRDAPLADGMTQELTAILARTRDLRVIASTSAFAFKDRSIDVRGIADSLAVSHVLEGSLQRVGSRLRVQVRLVDARDGSTRWSRTYDRQFQDVFVVQDEIARAVAGELESRFEVAGAGRLARNQTRNVAAYELYLRANDPVLTRSDGGVRQALQYFQEAIAVDPTYAAAHAGLAMAYIRMGYAADPGMPLAELYARADAAARRAVALDDSLAEAHQALGRVRLMMLDFPSAKTEIERSIDLDPRRAINILTLSNLYLWADRPAEALTEARRALDTDPLSPFVHAEVAEMLLANRRCDEALAQLARIRSVRPPLRRSAAVTGLCYAEKEMWPEAVAALRSHAEAGDPLMMAFLGHTLARAGQPREAERLLADLLARRGRTGAGAFEIAIVYAGLGDLDRSFAWLDRSIADYSLKVQIMTPAFDDLHDDPRFERFSARLGLQNL